MLQSALAEKDHVLANQTPIEYERVEAKLGAKTFRQTASTGTARARIAGKAGLACAEDQVPQHRDPSLHLDIWTSKPGRSTDFR
jgi:hypothetical protein